jgi:cysteinyl-tRNA synthetase
MLLVNGEKMAKSLGNFTTLRDALTLVPGEVIRFLLIRTHYRSTPDFSEAATIEAKKELDRFYRALERCPDAGGGIVPDTVLEALCDDLNTPLAFSAMHALADAAFAGDPKAAANLRASGQLIGLLTQAPDAWFRGGVDDADAIEAAIQERLDARRARDFPRADSIRAELAERGIVLEDGPGGTTWRRAQ